ncbi:hypothetical protein [Arthrobacter cupressi]|uniref:Uncharacterized protein n=1 Tax=Arthrobacter cupressi TaxID=1045773 RepID=A0A1G8SQ23_9MICC|nr:hypothetical protein [Arthrobacter cupressi]NYD78435.1 hypothetical protein [Arthrobacter cupressi]SDJ31311.1 hypothetical protein SAMN05216555_10989 [Arthrobacter cupressi]
MEFWNWLSGVLNGLGQILAAEKAPWWGIPVITASATLLGAFVSYTSTRASDNRKAKNEDRRRWDEEVRTHCVKYLKYMDSFKEKTNELKKFEGFGAATVKMVTDPKTGESIKEVDLAMRQKKKAQDKARKALDQMASIAPKALYQSCLALFVAVLNMSMADKVTPELEYKFKSSRSKVRAKLRSAMKVEPLPTKPRLRTRIKRWIKDPSSFVSDFQDRKANRAKIKELKKAKTKRA